MNKIKILDDITINKISAGEVVDRPASIVKELIENSLDADSKKIVVEIKGGGIKYIRVSDDGNGISSEDVEIAFFRHATSKINSYHDLNAIYTMGFRGEALASIAAVSKVNIFTKPPEEILGTHAEYIGGKLVVKENIGCPSGTTMIVEDVFYNTPARYKFLKSESTETKYIIDTVTREALINADISFELISNGKLIFKTSGKNNIQENIYDILGYQLKNHLVPIEFSYEKAIIYGFVSGINYYVKDQKSIFLYINRRYIMDDGFKKTIVEAYRSLLTLHQYPTVVLNITIPPELIDVNVHPSKLLVKIYKKEELYDFISKEIYKKLINNQRDSVPLLTTNISDVEGTIEKNKKYKSEDPLTNSDKSTLMQYQIDLKNINVKESGKTPDTFLKLQHEVKFHWDYKIIGQLFNTYILLEGNDELYILDQHAAHERVLYEKFSKEYSNKQIATQNLLVPEIIPLNRSNFNLINEIMKNLESLGFEIDTLGDNVLIVRAVPLLLNKVDYKDLVMGLLEEMEYTKIDLHGIEQVNNVIIKAACKSAVKAYKKLDAIEIDRLIADLSKCEEPFTCPHGRPTIIKKSRVDIEKLFKRR